MYDATTRRGPHDRTRAVLLGLALALSTSAAGAAEAAAPHQVWVANGLAAIVGALLGFAFGRSWALAGIVFIAALAYAAGRNMASAVPPETIAALGTQYPFHVQASALLVPLAVLAAFLWRRTADTPTRR